MARRPVNAFSMSFLDCMCCGFGAILLFFMIISARISEHTDEELRDRRSEAMRMELETEIGRENLVRLRNSLADLLEDQAVTQGQSREVVTLIRQTREEIATLEQETTARKKSLKELEADLRSLEEESRRLSAASVTPEEAGDRIQRYRGEGRRQYLTGLKIGGERIMILVDASASMLDDTIVNVLRRRNMSDDRKLAAPKWRRAVATVDWLTAQVPPGAQVQLMTFNVTAKPLLEGAPGGWHDVGDGRELSEGVAKLRKTVPEGGTNLLAAFQAVANMSPRPDNLYLLVDGLPTRATSPPARRTVTGKQRLAHFKRALRELPSGVPVNVILYPMEGDPAAAPAYWQLARTSGGSFMSPSEDWP